MSVAQTLTPHHPVHSLVVEHFGRRETLFDDPIATHPDLDREDVRDALTVLGAGLDHTVGEQALAFGDFSVAPSVNPLATFLLVTDRRLIGTLHREAGRVSEARFGAIEAHRERRRFLGLERHLRAGGRWHDFSFDDAKDELAGFLDALLAAAPAAREPRGRPLCAPTVDDPTGASLARVWMPVADRHAARRLIAVREGARRGWISSLAARDLVGRIALAYRNRAFGRGRISGRAMSPLAADDLAAVLVDLLGAPRRDERGPVRSLELATGMSRGLGRAALGTALGLSVGALTGFGWTVAPRRVLDRLTVRMADMQGFSGFRLEATGRQRALHREAPGYACALERALLDREEAMLDQRCAVGWSVPPEVLLRPGGGVNRHRG